MFETQLSDSEQLYTERATLLIKKYGWTLLSIDELVQRTMRRRQTDFQGTLDQTLICAYMISLYDACSGREGFGRREDGYTELFRMVYSYAMLKRFEPAEEIAQATIERVLKHFDDCRKPGAFWEFVRLQMNNALRSLRRWTKYPADSLDQPSMNDEGQNRYDVLEDTQSIAPATVVIQHETKERISACLNAYLREHPRSHNQLAALWLKYITGLDDNAISRTLETTVSHVHTLRSRAIKRLRDDPRWQAVATDLGIAYE
ncbi:MULTISPECIES: RNA polymerase sigma factor [Herpetosiphon]|uniref:RNA polymerase sigma-70 region 2 domain-containing protein n=1 Tax=Herpetosiphon geysericola TaxID=70996 RepID=A0A0P6Z139_9CHLR|nr:MULTISPECIES: sigma-70 family RNA polymerase sigma factor [Herpetosiphon]KPL91019.1 hypothetical protein SE18_04500 [Herpetosiphon geysericola]